MRNTQSLDIVLFYYFLTAEERAIAAKRLLSINVAGLNQTIYF